MGIKGDTDDDLPERVAELERLVQQLRLLALGMADEAESRRSPHVQDMYAAPDFSTIVCGTEHFYFNGKLQRRGIEVLWRQHCAAYGVAVTADQLVRRIGAEVSNFRIGKLFKPPARGRLIRQPAAGMVLLDDPRRRAA